MTTFRIALANLLYPATPAESVTLAEHAIAQAAAEGAGLVCFPECFIPGYRAPGKPVPPHDPAFFQRAWVTVAAAAKKAQLAVIRSSSSTRRSVPRTTATRALLAAADTTAHARSRNMGSWGGTGFPGAR